MTGEIMGTLEKLKSGDSSSSKVSKVIYAEILLFNKLLISFFFRNLFCKQTTHTVMLSFMLLEVNNSLILCILKTIHTCIKHYVNEFIFVILFSGCNQARTTGHLLLVWESWKLFTYAIFLRNIWTNGSYDQLLSSRCSSQCSIGSNQGILDFILLQHELFYLKNYRRPIF